jgi:hypothetical protein
MSFVIPGWLRETAKLIRVRRNRLVGIAEERPANQKKDGHHGNYSKAHQQWPNDSHSLLSLTRDWPFRKDSGPKAACSPREAATHECLGAVSSGAIKQIS